MKTTTIRAASLLGEEQCADLGINPERVLTITLPDAMLAPEPPTPVVMISPKGKDLDAYQQRMELAFMPVKPDKDWKGPINTFVAQRRLDRLTISIDDVREAIIHFTATVPTITPAKRKFGKIEIEGYNIKAAGYRAGPAGP